MHGPGMESELKGVSCGGADWLVSEGSALRGYRRYRAYYLTERSSYLLNPFAGRQREDSRARLLLLLELWTRVGILIPMFLSLIPRMQGFCSQHGVGRLRIESLAWPSKPSTSL